MSHSTSSQSVAKDERAWLQMLGAIGPLTYQSKDIGRSGDIGEMGWVVSMDATQLVLAVGARAGRGLGVLFGLLILPAAVLIAWVAIKNNPLPGIDYGGVVLSAFILFASVLAISFDLRRVSESRQLKLLAIEGVPMSNSDKRSWLVVLDPAVLSDPSAKGLKGDALAKKIAEAIQTPDRLPSLQASAFRSGVVSPGFGALSGFCVGALQGLNFTKLVADYTGAMKQEQSEAQQRMWAGGAAILGTFGEATGAGLEALGKAKLSNARGLAMSQVPDAIKFSGRVLGLGAGLFVAYLDLMQARDAKAKGDIGLTLAYAGSGILGGLLAAAFFKAASLGPVIWFFVGLGVLLLLGVTAWIEKKKDNPVQEWLMRSHFGTRPQSEKYATQAEEAKDLEAAFA